VALTPTWNESAWFADYVLPMGHAGERHDLMSQETHAAQWIAFRQPVRRVAMERLGKKVRFTYSVPGLPEAAAKEGLTPLEYMRKYAAFEVKREVYTPYENEVEIEGEYEVGEEGRVIKDGKAIAVLVDGKPKVGFPTPSGKLEFFSPTLYEWGWKELEYPIPWVIKSHVHPDHIDITKGEMLLLPTFRLPTLIHTRSANAKWLYEISHKNPIWMHFSDAERLGVKTGDLVRVETEIGYFVDKVWVTEGIKPGIIAMSHHLGRWRLKEDLGVNRQASNLVRLEEGEDGTYQLKVVHGARPFESPDPDTSRIWWEDVGVHQNLTHMEVYRKWVAMTRPASKYSPDGTRRPYWLKRPLKPVWEAYLLPKDKKS